MKIEEEKLILFLLKKIDQIQWGKISFIEISFSIENAIEYFNVPVELLQFSKFNFRYLIDAEDHTITYISSNGSQEVKNRVNTLKELIVDGYERTEDTINLLKFKILFPEIEKSILTIDRKIMSLNKDLDFFLELKKHVKYHS